MSMLPLLRACCLGLVVVLGWLLGAMAPQVALAPTWVWWLAPLLGLPISGGLSAGLLSMAVLALVAVLLPGPGPGWLTVVVVATLGAALARLRVRGGAAAPWALLLACGVWLGGRQQALLLAATLPLLPLVAALLVPRRGPTRGVMTLVNTLCGQGCFILLCSLLPLLAPVLLPLPGRRWLVTVLLRMGARCILAAPPFMGWRVRRDSALPAGPWVLISNHQSVIDILGVLSATPRRCLILAKSWVFRTLPLCWAARLGGMIPTELLEEGRLSAKHLDPAADLVVFPEGTRSADGRLGRFRRGAQQAAADLGRPLVLALQLGTGRNLRRGAPWIRPASVCVDLLPAPDCETPAALRAAVDRLLDERHRIDGTADVLGRAEDQAQRGIAARWRWWRQERAGWWRAAAPLLACIDAVGPIHVQGPLQGSLIAALRQLRPWQAVQAGDGTEAVALLALDDSPPRRLAGDCCLLVKASAASAWAVANDRQPLFLPDCALVLLCPTLASEPLPKGGPDRYNQPVGCGLARLGSQAKHDKVLPR